MFSMRAYSLFHFVLINNLSYSTEINLAPLVWLVQLIIAVLNLVLCLVVFTCFAFCCISDSLLLVLLIILSFVKLVHLS